MPPVMGSAAFMMIQFVGTSYQSIIMAAVLPAVLYYLALFAAVHFYSVRYGLRGMPPERPFSAEDLLKRGTVFFLPLLVVMLALTRYSPHMAVLYSLATLLVVSSLPAASRLSPRKLAGALREAAEDATPTVCAAACVGIIIAMVMLTGLGLRLPDLILNLAGNNLLIVLVLVMLTSLLLGMGLPTVVCYLLLATIMAPALVKLGVGLMAAHLFILYFGILSMITPPVALAAYAAGAIGGANLMHTGFTAWKLALSGFIIPFMFVYGPALLLQGTPVEVVTAVASSSLGVIVLGAAVMGYFVTELRVWERAALLAASLLLIKVGWITDLIGLGLIAGVFLAQRQPRRQSARPAPVPAAVTVEEQGP
ncbi:MAG: TRAP transporter fused permease subunit [Deltaproteobacteria bacterium]|nr:TRAP transporter fused permease subunit [Deltaproteobacteria bacterium]